VAIAGALARGQYPTVSEEDQTRLRQLRAASDRRSDEAFANAMPVIEEWARKGKPYIPWAGTPGDLPQASIPAFPGAEGGGAYSFGGRGGRVIVVTSLEDSGPGTFRAACEEAGPRIVVFNVAGIIRLKDRVRIRAPYITIAGQSAPGDGVCIAGANVAIDTHDVVIRHMRFRRGETWVGDRDDSIGGNPVGNIMIDHVSASWGLDENMSVYRHIYDRDGMNLKLPTVNVTIQNSIFSECLNTYGHAFGSTIGGYNSTFHHNLWANNAGRNPSVGMNGDFTFVNNVLFNWVHRSVDGGDHRSYFNVINNYYKPGPATPRGREIAWRLLKPESQRSRTVIDNFGQAYVSGNVVEGNEQVTRDNWAGGVQPESQAPVESVLPKIRSDRPFPHARITIQPAQQAYEQVLASAGATLPKRDAIDQRIVQSVRSGAATAQAAPDLAEELARLACPTTKIPEVVALVPKGIITKPDQVGGYPEYKGRPHNDADNDGMPDEWETTNGLDPYDASDAVKDSGDGYANIEKFLSGVAAAGKGL
jgi:pectate lyase